MGGSCILLGLLSKSNPIQIQAERALQDKVRKAIKAALTVAVATTLALFAAEGLLRLAWVPLAERSTPESEAHPVYLWAPRPGLSGERMTPEYHHAFAHSPQGLRSTPVLQPDRPAGTRARVLFLGDSFTYGLGAADGETFVARIAAAWPDVEVVNAGCNGYGQRQELAILDTLGAALRPDLTVVMFFWNDVEDNIKRTAPAFRRDAGGRVMRTDLKVPADFDPLALRQSAPSPRLAERKPFWTLGYLRELVREAKVGLRGGLLGGARRKIQTPAERAAAWPVTAELLGLLQARAAEIGTRLVVVSIPDYNQVDPAAAYRGIEPVNYDIESQLAQVTRDLGIPYIDLLPEMQLRFQAGQPAWYYARDRHLTPAGNAVLAGILQVRLADFLPSPVPRSIP